MSEFSVDFTDKTLNNKLIERDRSLSQLETEDQSLFKQVDQISEKIKEISSNRTKFSDILRLINNPIISSSKFNQELKLPDQKIFYNIQKNNLHGITIAGVDGGLVKKSFTGVNIAAFRAIGAVFTFGRKNIIKNHYYPNRNPKISLKNFVSPMSNMEWDQISSFLRANCELKLGLDLLSNLTNKKIDFLLMDGSFKEIHVYGSNFKNNLLLTLKNEYARLLRDLIDITNEKGIVLAWIVKDSKLRDFSSVIFSLIPELSANMHELMTLNPNEILKNLNDQLLMNYVLFPNQRSFIITKEKVSNANHSNFSTENFSFYLKVVPYDIPIRIDFSIPKSLLVSSKVITTADKISSVVCPLSNISSDYSLPSPLIEADARAKISQDKFSSIIELIQNKIPNNFEFKDLKRSRSPFKFN
ncbi:MAG: DNA double-strand break repair nuclease NurA [Candidatus Hodarchaeales archaeon]